MKNMKNLIVFFLGVVLLSSCSGLKVTTDYDNTVDFSNFKTLEYWGWAEKSDEELNRFDRERIEMAFGQEFTKRGYSILDKGEGGDIIVSLFIVTEEKTQRTASTTHMGGGYGGYGGYYGYGPGWGWGGGQSYTTVNEYDYVVGTLLISVYDAKSEKLIWQSAGSGEVEENPQKREKSIPVTIAKIMKDYPVKPVTE